MSIQTKGGPGDGDTQPGTWPAKEHAMTRATGYAWLVASLTLITSAQVVRAQVTSDWPVANATPQQTRFANLTFGGPPVGILWRATNSIASSGIVSDGLLVLRSSSNSVWTTRIYDAENGQCLFSRSDDTTY